MLQLSLWHLSHLVRWESKGWQNRGMTLTKRISILVPLVMCWTCWMNSQGHIQRAGSAELQFLFCADIHHLSYQAVIDLFKLAGTWPAKCHLCCDAPTTLLATKIFILFLQTLLMQHSFYRSWIKQIDCSFCPWFLGSGWICFLVLGFQNVWISPLFRLIFLSVMMWSGALGKDREEQQQQLGSEQSLWLPLWERTQAGDCSDINIRGWIDSVQDMSLLGAVKLRHDCFPSFVLLCEGMKGVQQQVSFLPQNKLLEDKWSSAVRSCWCCFPLGFKFCTQSQSW